MRLLRQKLLLKIVIIQTEQVLRKELIIIIVSCVNYLIEARAIESCGISISDNCALCNILFFAIKKYIEMSIVIHGKNISTDGTS